MKKQTRIVIIHGSYVSPEINWFPWLKHELEMQGHIAIVPKFPTPDNRTILIGHSIGAGFILSLLNEVDSVPIKAAFLVAGFLGKLDLPDYDTINKTFVCGDFDWQRIKRNSGGIYIINGENDPYVSIEKGKAIADYLSLPLELIPNGGHLNAEFGFTSFPLLLKKIHPFLS